MEFKQRTLIQLADMICGNFKAEESFFHYRRSGLLTEFFRDCDTDYVHDGSTRHQWVAGTLERILSEPQPQVNTPPETFSRVIRALMDRGNALNEGIERMGALALLNAALIREGFEAFYAPDNQCYLRHLGTNTVAMASPNPHRPFSASEVLRREQLAVYLDRSSEDELTAEVLLPSRNEHRRDGIARIHTDRSLRQKSLGASN